MARPRIPIGTCGQIKFTTMPGGHVRAQTGGIYRYSRNPQYLGLGLAATGAAIASRSGFAGLLAAGVWVAYRRWIPAEERHMARIFGGEYATYRDSAARWIGPPSID